MTKPRPWHALLFAAFPVLVLFQHNVHEVATGTALAPLGLVVGAAAVLLAVAALILRDLRRAALLVTLAVLLFFSYGYAADATRGWSLAGVTFGRDRYLLVLWTLLAIGGGFGLLRIRSGLPDVTKILNIVAAVLVLTTSIPIAATKIREPHLAQAAGKDIAPQPNITSVTADGKRDIYYVIFDRYGGEDALKKYFAFDNHAFLDSIEQRGFYVARDARGPYPNTAHSLATSLNMNYLDDLAKRAGSGSSDWGPVYAMLKDHAVGRFLKSQGYRYVQIGSRWEPTRTSTLADETIQYDPLSEFSRTLLQTTPIGPISKSLGVGKNRLDPRRVEYNRVLFQFEQLVKAGDDGKPTFIFAHILLPHDPYVFQKDGSFLPEAEMKRRPWSRNYLEQLQFANVMIDRTLDRLLAVPEAQRPIMIFQSDEGPPPRPDKEAQEENPSSWASKSTGQLQQKFGILNMYYLPGIAKTGLYPSISPVNSFRKVFSLYFGANLPLLPDESYIWIDKKHLYDFERITDRVKA